MMTEDEHPNHRKTHEYPQAWLCGTGMVMWNEDCMLYARQSFLICGHDMCEFHNRSKRKPQGLTFD